MLESYLINFVHYFILGIDILAILIILVGVLKSLIYFVDGKRSTNPGIVIGKAMDLGLRYLMVGEVLHSVTSSEVSELYPLALLLAIRIVIVFVNQKELEHELAEELELQKELTEEIIKIKPQVEEAKEA